ncbi:MAG: S-layer homology domain-containing protein [Lachnoclostridium sp.]
MKEGEFYTNAVIWASENGIVTGYTDGDKKGYFGSLDSITREQMMTMMYRYTAY